VRYPIARLLVCGALGLALSLPTWMILRRYEATAKLSLDLQAPLSEPASGWDFNQYASRLNDYVADHAIADIANRPWLAQNDVINRNSTLREQMRSAIRYVRQREFVTATQRHYCCFYVRVRRHESFVADALCKEVLTQMIEYPQPCCPDCSCFRREELTVLDPSTVHVAPDPREFLGMGTAVGFIVGMILELNRARRVRYSARMLTELPPEKHRDAGENVAEEIERSPRNTRDDERP
jgi:hypothetical protein